jgi:hypothetical protein
MAFIPERGRSFPRSALFLARVPDTEGLTRECLTSLSPVMLVGGAKERVMGEQNSNNQNAGGSQSQGDVKGGVQAGSGSNPNWPSTTGNPSGGGRGNAQPKGGK